MSNDIANIAELNQYLTFTLGDELFALDIRSVREILDDTDITKIPRTPEFMRGVINLRGHAVPVVDLKLRFGMDRTEMTVNTCVIITELKSEGEQIVIGTLADSVQEVVEIRPDSIDPPPKMGASIDTAFMKGMGKQGDEFVLILDISEVFTAEELAEVAESSPDSE